MEIPFPARLPFCRPVRTRFCRPDTPRQFAQLWCTASPMEIPFPVRYDWTGPMSRSLVQCSLHFKASFRAKSLSWISVFIYIKIRTDYRNKNFVLGLALKERLRRTRKWSIHGFLTTRECPVLYTQWDDCCNDHFTVTCGLNDKRRRGQIHSREIWKPCNTRGTCVACPKNCVRGYSFLSSSLLVV